MIRKYPVLLILAALVSLSVSLLAFAQANDPISIPNGLHTLACISGQPPTLEPPDRVFCPPAPTATPTSTPVLSGFMDTFDGAPATPLPWEPPGWDVTVHSRDVGTWAMLDGMAAGHGHDCAPPPASHTNSSYGGAVFQCNHHVMTAINASGYGVIYLTPAQLVDFSAGEAVIRFDVSTLRTSNRDWIDLWITPYEDNLVAPLEDWLPDLNGEPRQAIHIRMKFGSGPSPAGVFQGFLINNFEDTPIPQRRTIGYESFFPPSALLRQTFELRISRTHVRFGMPVFDLWWLDTDIAPLDWTAGIVQFGHHSYNPAKDCSACTPNTWHWDNVSIEPARPIILIHANRRFVNAGNATTTFSEPSPANARLRFSGIGNSLEFSLDGGATWQPAALQAQKEYHGDHFRTYWTPIPAGISSIQFRGQDWYGGQWHVRDLSMWSLGE
jgi:hypothetical protein